ncbi:MAG: thymidylate synthase ThyX [Spirochaetales bacterium]|nr:thymidylate synthase ThyX [Spirochaetales bacterium]
MKVTNMKIKGSWREVADSARTTINMEPGTKEPSSLWKRKMLLAEHSPIRQMFISAKWIDLPYWVSVHFVRHKIGIEHWVRTQRSDRTGTERGASPQNAEVEHEILASFQAVIAISRKRLCRQASPETQQAWKLMVDELKEIEPELYSVCVPDCVYRGWCMEYKSCGYHETKAFQKAVEEYREGINQLKD